MNTIKASICVAVCFVLQAAQAIDWQYMGDVNCDNKNYNAQNAGSPEACQAVCSLAGAIDGQYVFAEFDGRTDSSTYGNCECFTLNECAGSPQAGIKLYVRKDLSLTVTTATGNKLEYQCRA